jgi:hypothetical protein
MTAVFVDADTLIKLAGLGTYTDSDGKQKSFLNLLQQLGTVNES